MQAASKSYRCAYCCTACRRCVEETGNGSLLRQRIYEREAAFPSHSSPRYPLPHPTLMTSMPSPSVSFATTALALCGALAAAASASASSSVNSTVVQACATAMNGALPTATPANFDFSGNVRRYYVAAEQVEWDYAPTGVGKDRSRAASTGRLIRSRSGITG